MNGRVGVESEFTHMDTNDTIIIPTRSVLETPRRNCNSEKCIVGEKIINLCKSYDMQIANGRLCGDFLGNFTHNKNTEQSAIDLVLISDRLFPYIDDFKVLPQPEFCDHCKIVLTIKNLKSMKTKQNNYKWLNRKQEYKWGKFRMALSSTTVTNMIKNCKQRIEAGLIESSGKIIQKIFHEAADLSLEKN